MNEALNDWQQGVYFVSGIDTDIGKTQATGFLARQLLTKDRRVITQKLVQTGCDDDIAADIVVHRRIMGVPMLPEDASRLTMPAVMSYPASPHLSARLDNVKLNLTKITEATQVLADAFDIVLLEGAGGLCVPLTEDLLTIDYVAACGYPVILVTSGRLGSINHTLLSLKILRQYGIELAALAYNQFDDSSDEIISNDTKQYFKKYLQSHFKNATWLEIPVL